MRYALDRPMVSDPGTSMEDSTGTSHILSTILTRATKKSTHQFAAEVLARPLGISLERWPRDPQGIYFGGNEMRLTPRDMWKFGELYRNHGEWEGRQIVPAEWIRTSWQPRTVSRFNGHHYGFGWWIRSSGGHEVYFAWGYGGQYIFIVPELELVMVTTSDASTARSGDHLRAVHLLLDDAVRWAE